MINRLQTGRLYNEPVAIVQTRMSAARNNALAPCSGSPDKLLTEKIAEAPVKILIIKPSALGDVVHSLPFLSAMRSRFPSPDYQLHWVVAKGFRDLLDGHPMIDRLWVIDKDEWKKAANFKATFSAMKSFAEQVRREKFDLVVDIQGLFRSGIISWATRSSLRVGFKEAREGSRIFYTHHVKGGTNIHAVERYLKVAETLGCRKSTPDFPFPPFPTDSPLLRSLPRTYAVVAPSAGGKAKKWPPERFGELASKLPLKTIIVAGAPDRDLAEEVLRASRGNALSLAGKTSLKELIAVIKGASCLVSNDSGPMHIAAAFGIPVFALIGPTNPVRTGPYGKIHTIISAGIECSPCYRRRKCANWRCMTSITVEQVLDCIAAKGLI